MAMYPVEPPAPGGVANPLRHLWRPRLAGAFTPQAAFDLQVAFDRMGHDLHSFFVQAGASVTVYLQVYGTDKRAMHQYVVAVLDAVDPHLRCTEGEFLCRIDGTPYLIYQWQILPEE